MSSLTRCSFGAETADQQDGGSWFGHTLFVVEYLVQGVGGQTVQPRFVISAK